MLYIEQQTMLNPDTCPRKNALLVGRRELAEGEHCFALSVKAPFVGDSPRFFASRPVWNGLYLHLFNLCPWTAQTLIIYFFIKWNVYAVSEAFQRLPVQQGRLIFWLYNVRALLWLLMNIVISCCVCVCMKQLSVLKGLQIMRSLPEL